MKINKFETKWEMAEDRSHSYEDLYWKGKHILSACRGIEDNEFAFQKGVEVRQTLVSRYLGNKEETKLVYTLLCEALLKRGCPVYTIYKEVYDHFWEDVSEEWEETGEIDFPEDATEIMIIYINEKDEVNTLHFGEDWY